MPKIGPSLGLAAALGAIAIACVAAGAEPAYDPWAWLVWGDEIGRKTEELKGQFRSFSERTPSFRAGSFRDTGNVAFDEYRSQELKRLEEERRKLEDMRAEFETFLKDLRRVKDQEEFDRFMRDFRNRTSGSGEATA